MTTRTLKHISVVLLLSLVLTGCGTSLSGRLPGPRQPVFPSDDNLIGANGPISLFKGKVVFADTGLGLTSTITFRTGIVRSDETGEFGIDLPQGTHEYVIQNLLGEYKGVVDHDGGNRKHLTVPAFKGWDTEYFDETLIANDAATVRWKSGTVIPVWIESIEEDPNVTQKGVDTAAAAFLEWEEALGEEIRFNTTSSKDKASEEGITVEFISRDEMKTIRSSNTVVGHCTFFFDPSTREITSGRVHIVHDRQDSISLHLHEVGHCIGMSGHSPYDNDVMYPWLMSTDNHLTEREKNLAGLLYSLPPGTPRFSARTDVMEPVVNDDGLIVVSIDTTWRSR